MSEPCAHERSDELKSFVASIRVIGGLIVERDEARAEVALLREAPRGKAKCSCNLAPSTNGPEQDCPEHGDVRWYSAWLEEASDAYNAAAAALNRIDALTAGIVAPDRVSSKHSAECYKDHHDCLALAIRDAMEPTP